MARSRKDVEVVIIGVLGENRITNCTILRKGKALTWFGLVP